MMDDLDIEVTIYEYGTNELLDAAMLRVIPRVGEFFIMTKTIDATWEDNMYIVRGVTHTLGGEVAIHIEKQNMKELHTKEERIKDIMDRLNRGFKRDGI